MAFKDWDDLLPYINAKKAVAAWADYLAEGGSPKDALQGLDQYQHDAEKRALFMLGDWQDCYGDDPAIFFLSHRNGMRVVRWARARMFYRAVLNWEPPDKLPSYEWPIVDVGEFRMAIWN